MHDTSTTPAIPNGIGVYDRPASSPLNPVMLVGGLAVLGAIVAALMHYF